MTAENKPGQPDPVTRAPCPAGFSFFRGAENGGGSNQLGKERPPDPSDIDHGDWVERNLPVWGRPYARLARLDRPIGTWLLLFPGWWGIALAAPQWPDPLLLALFALGAVVMRGAGCTLNDIADRHYDGQVARTRLRPLPSGAISVRGAVVFLILQLAVGAAILFGLNRISILLGIAVLGPDRYLSLYEAGHLLAAGISRSQF